MPVNSTKEPPSTWRNLKSGKPARKPKSSSVRLQLRNMISVRSSRCWVKSTRMSSTARPVLQLYSSRGPVTVDSIGCKSDGRPTANATISNSNCHQDHPSQTKKIAIRKGFQLNITLQMDDMARLALAETVMQ